MRIYQPDPCQCRTAQVVKFDTGEFVTRDKKEIASTREKNREKHTRKRGTKKRGAKGRQVVINALEKRMLGVPTWNCRDRIREPAPDLAGIVLNFIGKKYESKGWSSTTAVRINQRWVKPEPAPCNSSSVPDRDRVRKMRTSVFQLFCERSSEHAAIHLISTRYYSRVFVYMRESTASSTNHSLFAGKVENVQLISEYRQIASDSASWYLHRQVHGADLLAVIYSPV